MTADGSGTPRRRRNPRGRGGQLAEDILDAGRQIIEETGDEARVTLSEIARRLGIAVPSIYDHFPGVGEICRQVVVRAWAEHDRAVTAGDPGAPPREQIRDFAHAYVAFARERWGLYRVLHSRSSPSAIVEVGEAALAGFSRLVDAVALVLAVDARSAQAWDAAVGLWIQLHGIASLPPVHPRFPWPDDDRLIEAALRRSCVD
ncbi:TetR/AcrR family transcriptional regulator [Nakamurella deserti]|uniref:TetR/AcrR family transcriptional regulator n=1 Tax=Nakamurella deserti TaxID=2164074 RepID=UPI000DBE2CD1|nr:TetR/AcrR family transcriptional regulator [Nakamurella deserti]